MTSVVKVAVRHRVSRQTMYAWSKRHGTPA